MKILILLIVSSLLLISCSNEDNLVTPSVVIKGSIFITSIPSGAEIWLQGVNTSQITPDTLINLTPGSYLITLKLQNYNDTTFVVSVDEGQITSMSVTLLINLGSIYVSSNPAGAEIWLDGVNTSLTTPNIVTDVLEGLHSVTLKLQDYYDTTFVVSVIGGQISVVSNVMLVSNINITLFGPIRIYEIFGTPASQPTGLDLSSGMAYGIASPQANLVDIYYYSDVSGTTFLIQSADLHPELIRRTDFLISSGSNLFDGVDSPLRGTGTWTNNIDDFENNYVFLYDHDGHYSKMKIVNRGGGGGPGDPSWVDIQWYYNNITMDNRF